MQVKVIKKDGRSEKYDRKKIVSAITKSADRVQHQLTEYEINEVCRRVELSMEVRGCVEISVHDLHSFVEGALDIVCRDVALSYKDFRNYKAEQLQLWNDILQDESEIRTKVDRSNANTLSTLLSVKRSLVYKAYSKKMYQAFFLSREQRDTIREGYIYIHDLGDRGDNNINCCLADLGKIIKGGFELFGVHYNEPKTLSVAFAVMDDLIQNMSAMQYGGFTVPEIDTILVPYAEKSYNIHYDEFISIAKESEGKIDSIELAKKAEEYAIKKVRREYVQGWQGLEYKLASCISARGDFPFITITFGIDKTRFGSMGAETVMEVRKKGQGVKGREKPVLFPKLVFLYDENLHGEKKELEWLFDKAIECQASTMLPDFLSLTGDGYVPDMYKKYGRIVSPMGCRAYLSPWYERGGLNPADENDKPIFTGRANLGAISLNLPMIMMKSKLENKDFFKLLEFYLDMIREIHKKTYAYVAKQEASISPLSYMQGGLYGGNLKPHDKIEKVIKTFTLSFGFTALHELQMLYDGRTLYKATKEDGHPFAYKVLKYINDYAAKAKIEDGLLYAIYATPAESLCGTQCAQFKKKYGVIPGVSDKEYFNNSFHMAVTENITPTEKQDVEYDYFHNANGGHIQYVKVPTGDNLKANKMLMKRAMEKGYYAGLNITQDFCDDCGYRWFPEKGADPLVKCPKCQSKNLTEALRVCGYLGYSKINGDTRLNKAKIGDIRDRKSM